MGPLQEGLRHLSSFVMLLSFPLGKLMPTSAWQERVADLHLLVAGCSTAAVPVLSWLQCALGAASAIFRVLPRAKQLLADLQPSCGTTVHGMPLGKTNRISPQSKAQPTLPLPPQQSVNKGSDQTGQDFGGLGHPLVLSPQTTEKSLAMCLCLPH